jgi:DNA-binding winged helix-turn-helix (wHTH) protein/tetratricopeptide (TPR) repeat protein
LSATQKLLRFGTFELNLATEELRKNGIPLKLSPQPFRILALLASQSGQIVTRDEIRQQVWGGETYVDFEHGMNQCIKQIRTALSDNTENPVYVETLPRRGYRFLAPVSVKTIESLPTVVESQSGLHSAIVPTIPAPVSGDSPAFGASTAPVQLAATAPAAASDPFAVAPALAPVQGSVTTHRRHWFRAVLFAVVVLGVIGGIVYWQSQRATALTERDTVVLSDFKNTTGDPVFDSALRQSLTFDLEGSPLINVLSDERVDEQLRYMGQPRDARLTQAVTRQVCQRSGSKAMIVGSISAMGSQYLIGLEAIDCANGESLGHEQEEADSREHITKALSKAAASMRRRLGESLASVQKFNKPAEDATTPSLEALQAFNQARIAQITGNGDPIFYFKRALDLDPNLAVGYVALGTAYDNAGQVSLARQNYTKAYELRDRVSSPQERFYIEGHYYDSVTGELLKAIETYQDWTQNYPGNYKPHENLSVVLAELGRYEMAAKEALEALRLSPSNGLTFANLVGTYNALDRLDDAKAAFEHAEALKLDNAYLHFYRYLTAFLQGDEAGMQQQAVWAMGKPGAEELLLSAQADTQAYRGRIGSSRAFAQQAVQLAKRDDAPETAATWKATAALREAEIGNASQARAEAAEALAMAPGRNVQVIAGLALARAGDLVQAQKIVAQLDQAYPHDTIMQGYSLPAIQAAIEVAKGNLAKAIDVLQQATPYELSNQSPAYLYPAYLRGEAYLMTGQGQQAVVELQKILAHPGIMQNFVTGALAHLQLARAQAITGNKEAARKSYQEFLSLWKEADAGIPVLEAAKTEYQRLN